MSHTHQINIIVVKQRRKIKLANVTGHSVWIEEARWTGRDGKFKKFAVRF